MERYQIILAYDGTDFHGSQYQTDTRTVQSVVQAALRKLSWTGKSVIFAGRTDAGVHASGQVVAFDLEWKHSPEKLQKALNALLPKDTAVSAVTVSSSEFHPRFDALSRSYRYRIYCQPERDPLRDRFAWRVWPPPALSELSAVAKDFIGIHDFASFGRPTRPGGKTIRALTQAEWHQIGDEFYFEVSANAFLYHMVRRLTFVQIAVGQGKLTQAEVQQHIHQTQNPPIQGLAPPQGLALIRVDYPPENSENKTVTE
jgi:tRNA pseudouridine38-40 synthase